MIVTCGRHTQLHHSGDHRSLVKRIPLVRMLVMMLRELVIVSLISLVQAQPNMLTSWEEHYGINDKSYVWTTASPQPDPTPNSFNSLKYEFKN